MQEFSKYRTFQTKLEFDDFIRLLEKSAIAFRTEDYPVNFISDPSNTAFSHEYVVKLQKESFALAHKIEEQLAEEQIKNVEPDYYLFNFTDKELIQLIVEQDEWSPFDVVLAKKILEEKGINWSNEEVEEQKAERLNALSKPEKKQTFWVILGYISAIFGGAFGILIGWHLHSHKRTLPTGERVFDYCESDRKHGNRIRFIGIIILSLGLILRLFEII